MAPSQHADTKLKNDFRLQASAKRALCQGDPYVALVSVRRYHTHTHLNAIDRKRAEYGFGEHGLKHRAQRVFVALIEFRASREPVDITYSGLKARWESRGDIGV